MDLTRDELVEVTVARLRDYAMHGKRDWNNAYSKAAMIAVIEMLNDISSEIAGSEVKSTVTYYRPDTKETVVL